MSREILDRCWETFQHSAFRLEALQAYAVPQEDAAWQAFTQGRPVPRRSPDTNPWLRRVAFHTAAGRRIYRVHIVDLPLSPYIRFELQGYQDNQQAGEDIYIAHRDAHPAFVDFTQDWWLFDEQTPVLLRYDDGQFLGADHVPDNDVAEYRRRRDLALQHAVPLDQYLSDGQEYRTA